MWWIAFLVHNPESRSFKTFLQMLKSVHMYVRIFIRTLKPWALTMDIKSSITFTIYEWVIYTWFFFFNLTYSYNEPANIWITGELRGVYSSSSSWPRLSKDLCGDISSCSNIICYWNLTCWRLIYWDFLRMICVKASKSVGGVFSGVSSGCLGQRTSQRTVSTGTASPQCGCSCGSSGSRTGRTFCHR